MAKVALYAGKLNKWQKDTLQISVSVISSNISEQHFVIKKIIILINK